MSLERLTDGIREVARGGSIIRPAITERVLKGLEHVRREFNALSPPGPLTRREVEILRLMADGYSNREIADQQRIKDHPNLQFEFQPAHNIRPWHLLPLPPSAIGLRPKLVE